MTIKASDAEAGQTGDGRGTGGDQGVEEQAAQKAQAEVRETAPEAKAGPTLRPATADDIRAAVADKAAVKDGSPEKPIVLNIDHAKELISRGELDPSKQYVVEIDSRDASKGGRNEAKELMEVLSKANGSAVFDKGYQIVAITEQAVAGRVSSSENVMTLEKDATVMIDGKPHELKAGTLLPVGTIMDRETGALRSAHPADKGVKVGELFIPNGTVLGQDVISADPKKQGQPFEVGGLVKARETTNEKGERILDSHTMSEKVRSDKWKATGEGNLYENKPAPLEHTVLPPNLTVHSKTQYDPLGVELKPGSNFRADGYSVTPKDFRETWNGYVDEKSYDMMKKMYADAGMSNSDQLIALEEDRMRKTGQMGEALAEKFRQSVRKSIEDAQAGKQVTFEIDARVKLTDATGQSKRTQAEFLYDELAKAYPDRHFVFSKPDYKPGDKNYSEIPAPKVEKDGLQISTKENGITLSKEVILQDGTKLPAGSKFAVGTTYDGTQVKSADPEGKVWAVTTEGKYIQVAGDGGSTAIPADSISQDPKLKGQVVDRKTADGKHENHIIVRTDKATAPDGRPLLDAYPSGGDGFENAYKEGSKPGYYATKPKSAEHFRLPENVKVEAMTGSGISTASGAEGSYFMTSGYGDAKDATAKNYTGRTEPRSAEELLRIRKELGMTEPTQAEAGLKEERAIKALERLAGANLGEITKEALARVYPEDAGKRARALETHVGLSRNGELVSKEQIGKWIADGEIPKDVIDGLKSKLDRGFFNDETARDIFAALEASQKDIKDEATRRFTESILRENEKLRQEYAEFHKTSNARNPALEVASTATSIVALAAVAAAALAYMYPEETRALVEKSKSKLKSLRQ